MNSIYAALAEALFVDPFYQAVTIDYSADPFRRKAVLEAYFALAIVEAQNIGEVRIANEDGAAIWLTNETSPETVLQQKTIRKDGLKALLGTAGYNNYVNISASMEQQTPSALHDAWYLSILGIREQARGRGVAHQLLVQTLVRADDAGVDCYLETFNPLSVPFYARLGFTGTFELQEPVTGRVYWLLVRKANTPRQ